MGNAIALSDYIINNDNGVNSLELELDKLLRKIR